MEMLYTPDVALPNAPGVLMFDDERDKMSMHEKRVLFVDQKCPAEHGVQCVDPPVFAMAPGAQRVQYGDPGADA